MTARLVPSPALRRPWGGLVRAAWVVLAAVSLGLFVAYLPAEYDRLAHFSGQFSGGIGLMPASAMRAGLAELGLSGHFYALYILTARSLFAAANLAMGLLLFRRRFDDGPALLLAFSFATYWVGFPATKALLLAQSVGDQLMRGLSFFGMLAFFVFLYIFPDGRFIPHWTRWLVVASLAAWLLYTFYPEPLLEPQARSLLVLGPSLFVGGVLAQLYRYRRGSDPIQQQQTKWMVFGFAAVLGIMWIAGLPGLVLPALRQPSALAAAYDLAAFTLTLLAALLTPLALNIAIFRYRLWDIDLIINRALVYSLLTALIVGLYMLGVGASSAVLRMEPGLGPALVALASVGALVPWLHGRLQRAADRFVPALPATLDMRAPAPVSPPASATTAPITLRGRPLALARAAWLAVFALVLALIIALVPINLGLTELNWQLDRAYPAVASIATLHGFRTYMLVLRYLVLAVFLITAALIFERKSNDRMAILVSLMLVILPITFSLGGHSETWEIYPLPWRWLLHGARELLAFVGGGIGLLAVFFLFPDSRFMPPSIRPWALGLGGVVLAFVCLLALGSLFGGPHAWPARYEALSEWVWGLFWLSLMLALALGAASQVYRYRRASSPTQRQQTKLVVFGLAMFPLGHLLSAVMWPVAARAGVEAQFELMNLHWQLAVIGLLPLTFAVSILRYRLWDIDLIINRALVYSGLTAMVISLYVLLVGALGTLVQSNDSLLFSVLITGLVALLFQPVRQRLQRGVNRLMYGERDDPATVLSRLAQRLQAAIEPGIVLATIVETMAQALKLPYVAIALKPAGTDEFRLVAQHGTEATAEAWPLIYQSETIGQLLVAPRAPGEGFSLADHRLLEDIAQHASAAVHAVRLTADLQRSRERLVTAREEERRRLRRDLHDGLGSVLAAVHLQSGALRTLYRQDPGAGDAAVEELRAQLRGAVADIRRLVYDLRPPALDELGLAGAIRNLASRSEAAGAREGGAPGEMLQVQVIAPEALGPLPAAVEVAAYRIVQEALANVVRHAATRICWVRVVVGDVLCLEIEDNGVGLPDPPAAGVGLRSMVERATELGGTCVVARRPEGGTRVAVRLPLSQEN